MPAPSPSWNLVRVYGTWRNLDGTPKRGVYKVSIPVKITNATDDSVISAGTFSTGTLAGDAGQPSIDVMVPATDDPDVQQTGWLVTVEVTFADRSKTERFRIEVPYADRPVADGGTGNGVNLRAVVSPDTIPVKDVLFKVGVPGGIALLDSTGNVLDAHGDSATAKAQEAASAAAAAQASAAGAVAQAQNAASLIDAPAGLAIDAHVGPTLISDGTDQTGALNSFLASASPLGVKRLIGSFSVSGSISVPANAYLDMSAATITQTASGVATLVPGTGATISGGKLVGKGTDYVAGTGGTPAAVGIRVVANDVSVRGVTITNHAGAGVLVSACSGFRGANIKVVGLGSPSIPANDASQFGIYVNAGCTDLSFAQIDLSNVSIGFISSYDTTHLSVNGIRVHDIPGQHGVYIQNGNGLNLSNADVWNCNLNGIKLQINATATTDMLGTAVTNVTATSCGDTGLSINNVDTALTRKWRGITIANVTSISCGRGVYLGSLRAATITGVTVYNCSLEGVTFVDSQNVTLVGAVLDVTGRSGIRFTGVANGSNDGISLSSIRTNNTGNNNVAGSLSSIYVNQCANLAINQWRATSSNGFVDYSLFFASATAAEQQTLTLRNCDLSAAVSGYEIRLMAGPVAVREFDNLKLAANQVLNYPTALVTRVGSNGINTVYSSSAIPTSGGIRGDICWNNTPAAAGVPGWVCTAAGTWKTMPAIGA